MKRNNKTIIVVIIIAALLLMNSGKKEAIGDANWPADCSFITNNNPYIARYTGYANAGIWISADINGDSVKEAFGYKSTSTNPPGAGWTVIKTDYNTYSDDIKTDGTYIYVTGSSGYIKFEKDYGAASNAVLTCGTTSTSFCYQESANIATSCGGLATGTYTINDYFYITYAKPVNVINVKWLVKHGNLNPYNVTIPNNCINTNIQLRFKSDYSPLYQSYGQCFNGTTWQTITQLSSNSGAPGCSGGAPIDGSKLNDGDWNTASSYIYGTTWYTSGTVGARCNIYEEAVWWEFSCTPNWVTGSWSPTTCPASCSQSRTVTDSNNCGTTASMPATTQSCTGGSCIPTCTNLADDNLDCTITLAEVITFATKWVNNQGVTLTDVIESANIWVDGGTYTG